MKPTFRRVRYMNLPEKVIDYIRSGGMRARMRGWAWIVLRDGVMYVANREDQWFQAQLDGYE